MKIRMPIEDDFFLDKNDKYTDSLSDFIVNMTRCLNGIFETLLLIDTYRDKEILPQTTGPNFQSLLGKIISTPDLLIEESFIPFQKTYIEEFFKLSLFKLSSYYEKYLETLVRELYWYNYELIKKEDRSIPIGNIFKYNYIASLKMDLVDELTLPIITKPYPKLVRTFENKFEIEIHSGNSKLRVEEVHNFLELGKLVIYNNGYCNKLYLNKVKGYEKLGFPGVLDRINSSIKIDFTWLYSVSCELISLAKYIDKQAINKYCTSRD